MSRLLSLYRRRYQSQVGGDPETRRQSALIEAERLLKDKVHGLCFSPYLEGQEPGVELSNEQIAERLAMIQPHTDWVRTFSCTDGNERIPALAKEQGFKTLVGIWLDEDLENNEEEIEAGIALAKAGYVDQLAVGNEVMLREEMSEQALVNYIERVKAAVPDVQVGYVDAYYLFEEHRAVADACDVIFANCYPFWEGYAIEHAKVYMKDMYYRAKAVAGDKPVVISETGWPTQGSAERSAVPGFDNALHYFVDTYTWAESVGVDVFYFEAFDEAWKVSDEGDVGAFWGIWDKDGKYKYAR